MRRSIQWILAGWMVAISLFGCAAPARPVLNLGPIPQPAEIDIIPRPVALAATPGYFHLNASTVIRGDLQVADLAAYLADNLDRPTGWNLPLDLSRQPSSGGGFIDLRLIEDRRPQTDGEYWLAVSPAGITIWAHNKAGLFYGIQTLRQLLPPQVYNATPVKNIAWTVPCVQIHDYPRFQWRGMMLDCSRHFFSKVEVERFIDLMAIHKMNMLHWHLTDDQGWRIQILRYPKLTQIGAWRKQTLIGHEDSKPVRYDGIPYGGFYTQEDIREIVQYAAERFVTIVPEIEMPGHSTAAVAAYPQIGNTTRPVEVAQGWGVFRDTLGPQPATIAFYENVLDEVMDLFPSPYIDLGGDEVPSTQWKTSPAARAQIKRLGLAGPNQVQAYILRRMAAYLKAKGRRLTGWDDIVKQGAPRDSVAIVWHRPSAALAAIEAGCDVVIAPESTLYFDHYQSKDQRKEPLAIGGFTPLRKVYAFNPMPSGLMPAQQRQVLGAQGQLWSEYIPTPEHLEYMAFPRECALAEDVWSPAEGKDYTDFRRRLAMDFKRLDVMGVNYRHPLEGE
ncbi:MAG TPA: beta-N-acetylhexosaminidase [Tepidisphaeraceae bacterium]|nr:beta-N-acetylhexosaminidase [Tepidisphaeraceae bacterium]